MMIYTQVNLAYRNSQKLYKMAKEMYHKMPNETSGIIQGLAWNLYQSLYDLKEKYMDSLEEDEEQSIKEILSKFEEETEYVDIPSLPILKPEVDSLKKPLF